MTARSRFRSPVLLVIALLIADLLLSIEPFSAHEVPAQIDVQAHTRVVGDRFHLLLRVPLSGLLNSKLPKEGPGYLALPFVGPALKETATALSEAIDIFQGDTQLGLATVTATRVSLPLDRGFATYDSAMALLDGPPLPPETQVFWQQGFADVRLEYPIAPGSSDFSMQFRLTPLAPKVTTILTFAETDRQEVSLRLVNDAGRVWLNPSAPRTVRTFVAKGMTNGLTQLAYVLFVVGLAVARMDPRIRLRSAAAFAGALTVAVLSLILTAATASDWWSSCLNALLMAAVLMLALQNVTRVRPSTTAFTASVLGVLLGLRTAIDLTPDLQFAGAHLTTASVAFVGGLLVIGVALLIGTAVAVALLARLWKNDVVQFTVLSAMVALLAWRGLLGELTLVRYLEWTAFDMTTTEDVLTWLLAIVAAAAAAWLLLGVTPALPADRSGD